MPIPATLLETPRTEPAPRGPTEHRPSSTGPVLIATAGDEASDAAVRLGWGLAGRTCGDVQVVTALEPAAPLDVRFTLMPPLPGELLAAERDAQLAAVREQLRRALPDGCDWPIAITDGPADEAIARAATESEARVIVLGRGRHGMVGRLAHGETVLRLLRHTDVPVYAVESGTTELARRVVVALDFSPYSIHAARAALELVAPDASVTLVHVWPGIPAVAPALTGWEQAYERALPELFDRARREIAAPETMQVETVTLTGRWPGRAVAGFAVAAGADLVVAATHGHGFLTRLVLGSVAAELLHGAPCSLLCVPGSATAHAAARATATAHLRRESIPSTAWEPAIQRIADRHGGRLCALAVSEAGAAPGPEIGPLPLASVGYVADSGTLVVTFGPPDAATPQLTYVLRGVASVDRHVDAEGEDRVLQVAGAGGTVALRLV